MAETPPAIENSKAELVSKVRQQGSDPAIVKKALEDSTNLARNLWISFLVFGTYLVITFGGTTHRQLFYEEPIVLPVLNAKLPLLTFYWVAPIMFVIYHLYLLLSLKLLADQVKHYVNLLKESGLSEEQLEDARLQLSNFPPVQMIAGTEEQQKSWSGWLIDFTVFTTVALGPIMLLLLAQLMFLPYHSRWVTNAHRAIIVVDLLLLIYFWCKITDWQPSLNKAAIAIATVVATAITSVFILVFPGESDARINWLYVETGAKALPHPGIANQPGDGYLYNTIVLANETVIDDDQAAKMEERDENAKDRRLQGDSELTYKRPSSSTFRNRDLKEARISNSDFRWADFSNSKFDSALIDGVQLQQADFQGASFEKAAIYGSSFDGADFRNAEMSGVLVSQTNLRGADLSRTTAVASAWVINDMTTANLSAVDLSGSFLIGNRIQMAEFSPILNGAVVTITELQGAKIDISRATGLRIENASLWRATSDFEIEMTQQLPIRVTEAGITPIDQAKFDKEKQERVRGLSLRKKAELLSKLEKLNPAANVVPKNQFTELIEAKPLNEVQFTATHFGALAEIACDQGYVDLILRIVAARMVYDVSSLEEDSLEAITSLLMARDSEACWSENKLDPDIRTELETVYASHLASEDQYMPERPEIETETE